MDALFNSSAAVLNLKRGPFGQYLSHLDSWVREQQQDGYKEETIKQAIRLVNQLAEWLERRGLGVESLSTDVMADFLQSGCTWARQRLSAAIAARLLKYLGSVGVIEPGVVPPRLEPHEIVHDFRRHLVEERGLAPATLLNVLPPVRRFLMESSVTGSASMAGLNAETVTNFVRRYVQRTSVSGSKHMVWALRAFLRFLTQRGDTQSDLAPCVPTVVDWGRAELPKSLEPNDVELLLSSCDRDSAVGRRDVAILLLMARLGLRACEVVSMRLEDIDWQTGEITVCGKGARISRLPLAPEVGQAVVDYLKHGRPCCSTRRLFVRALAPYRGFSTSAAIDGVVERALDRAGLDPPRKGAHLLRHSVAVRMLRRGASLQEIGQLLRHRHARTTAIYAKVDLDSLRALTQPWPGAT